MISPVPLDQLLANDPLAKVQGAIVATLAALLPGVAIVAHPGKVDLSELVAKSIVAAPGVGIGWSRMRRAMMNDGHYRIAVEWVAYIIAESRAVGIRRVEKEAIGLAIGGRLIDILADGTAPFWGLSGLYPPEETPGAELKPFFTVRDASQGTAYYVVTWTQVIASLGTSRFPQATGRTDPEAGTIGYLSAEELAAIAPWIPAREVDDDA